MIERPSPVIVLDFDGVLVDSNQAKVDAFLDLFPLSERAVVGRVVASHRETSRHEILERSLRLLGREESAGETIETLASRYDARVREAILTRGLIPATVETLEELAKTRHLYLSSGTPQASLEDITLGLGIRRYFSGVFGAPAPKRSHLLRIIREEDVPPAAVLVVGDGQVDLESARNVGCRFVGVANSFNGWRKENFPVISGLGDLLQHLRNGAG